MLFSSAARFGSELSTHAATVHQNWRAIFRGFVTPSRRAFFISPSAPDCVLAPVLTAVLLATLAVSAFRNPSGSRRFGFVSMKRLFFHNITYITLQHCSVCRSESAGSLVRRDMQAQAAFPAALTLHANLAGHRPQFLRLGVASNSCLMIRWNTLSSSLRMGSVARRLMGSCLSSLR